MPIIFTEGKYKYTMYNTTYAMFLYKHMMYNTTNTISPFRFYNSTLLIVNFKDKLPRIKTKIEQFDNKNHIIKIFCRSSISSILLLSGAIKRMQGEPRCKENPGVNSNKFPPKTGFELQG